jgi:hypothetical protein
MKTLIAWRTAFALCLFSATASLPLLAQSNPPPSRFNVQLGAIRAPTATEAPVVSWGYLPNLSFTADGKEVFLSNPIGGNTEILTAARTNAGDPWGPVQSVGAPVNTHYVEAAPCVSADGLLLVWCDGWEFASNPRPGGHGNSDLWMATRPDRASPWSAPVNLGPQINTAAFEALPRMTADVLELYFSRSGGGVANLYVSRRASRDAAWGQATPLPSYVNLPYGQWAVLPSHDGLTLLTGTLVSGDPSYQEDILVSTRKDRNSPWNLPVSIGSSVNSQWNQVVPSALAPDGSALYFLHDDGNGNIANGARLKRVELLPLLEIMVGYSSLINGVTLQASPGVAGPWSPVLEPAELVNGENRVMLPAKDGEEFYRLVRP